MLQALREHSLTQWIVLGLAVMAFILITKAGVSYLPDGGMTGAVKRVVLAV